MKYKIIKHEFFNGQGLKEREYYVVKRCYGIFWLYMKSGYDDIKEFPSLKQARDAIQNRYCQKTIRTVVDKIANLDCPQIKR